jgi:hypothetical protein
MDIYALTKKQRPSRLTMGKPVQFEAGKKETKEQQGMYIPPIDAKVTGPPTRDHWKVHTV